MSDSSSGKVALVTGAARGIDGVVTLELARANVNAMAVDWRPGNEDENGLGDDFDQTKRWRAPTTGRSSRS
jgi:NAD(P)-dependent dehydrogenase (short-subunit alcohol dehydrogenase family)